MHNILFEVTGEDAAWLEGFAAQRGQSINQLITDIVHAFRHKEENPPIPMTAKGHFFIEPSFLGVKDAQTDTQTDEKPTKKKAKK
jgi:hypothetical protein